MKMRGKRVTSLILYFAFLLIVVIIPFEILVRFSICNSESLDRIPLLSQASGFIRKCVFYYSDFSMGDSGSRYFIHWELRNNPDRRQAEFRSLDPDLGWVAGEYISDNPLTPYELAETKIHNPILFFGDSFVAGIKNEQRTIPARLESKLDSQRVFNFGVCGYGIDQTFLRIKKTIDYFNQPHILFGLYYDDISRGMMQVTYAPKPYFAKTDSLILQGVPVVTNPQEWRTEYPPNYYTCLAWVFLKGLTGYILESPWVMQKLGPDWYHCESKKSRKQAHKITRAIIMAAVEECKNRDIELTFVIFPFGHDIMPEYTSWHHKMVTSIMTELETDYIDCSEVYNEYYQNIPDANILYLLDYYGHPNAEQNRMIADKIASHLNKKYGYALSNR